MSAYAASGGTALFCMVAGAAPGVCTGAAAVLQTFQPQNGLENQLFHAFLANGRQECL